LIVTLFSSLKSADLIHFINGVTLDDLKNTTIPAPVLDYGHITDGIMDYTAATDEEPPGSKTGTHSAQSSHRKKIINRDIHVTEPALLLISAYTTAKCITIPTAGCENNVITHISLDGIPCAKDICLSSGHTGSLASTAISIRMLEPGKHSFKVEGIFTFYGDNPYIDLVADYCLLRKKSPSPFLQQISKTLLPSGTRRVHPHCRTTAVGLSVKDTSVPIKEK
jgi:hypothetical protein